MIDQQTDGTAVDLAIAAEGGIQVGSYVRRKVRGAHGYQPAGLVTAIYQVCGHPMRYHALDASWRARFTCPYKPHQEVTVIWERHTVYGRMDRAKTHMPLSRVVLVER